MDPPDAAGSGVRQAAGLCLRLGVRYSGYGADPGVGSRFTGAQIFVEQLVCFSCLGYTGVFGTDKRWKILCGGVLAIFIKFWAHVFSGVIFFSQNAWDGWGAWGYSLTYHLSSKIPEGVLSLVILMVLPLSVLKKAAKGAART